MPHHLLNDKSYSSCLVGQEPENQEQMKGKKKDYVFVYLPPMECDKYCFAWIHKDNIGKEINPSMNGLTH